MGNTEETAETTATSAALLPSFTPWLMVYAMFWQTTPIILGENNQEEKFSP
jgi:hypothetical protein